MRKLRHLVVLAAVALGIGVLSSPASASTDTSPLFTRVGSATTALTNTRTVTAAWVHQCAAMGCGYHAIDAGRDATAVCYAYNEGIWWNLVVTASPWDSSIPITGYVSVDALAAPDWSVSCDQYGVDLGPSTQYWWAHSCPSMSCGYGVINPGEDYRWFGYWGDWDLVIDRDSANRYLAGFIHS